MAELPADWIIPDWPAPPNVRALVTTRSGGVSVGRYASLNLGGRVDDDPMAVQENRARLRLHLPAGPKWLRQVHGVAVVEAGSVDGEIEADAVVTGNPATVCAIMMADCLPVLLADRAGRRIGAAHAGWRGLAGGVIENTVREMHCAPDELLAWLGPAIGPRAFEVGDEVRNAFVSHDLAAAGAFVAHGSGKWLADLFLLARQRLASAGVDHVHGGGLCTWSDAARFYSHRRDKLTGRMAALIWIEERDRA